MKRKRIKIGDEIIIKWHTKKPHKEFRLGMKYYVCKPPKGSSNSSIGIFVKDSNKRKTFLHFFQYKFTGKNKHK